MRYLARRLYFNSHNFLSMYVAEISKGEVVALYPFDVELQSMVYTEALMLSKSTDEVIPVCEEGVDCFPGELPHPCYVVEIEG